MGKRISGTFNGTGADIYLGLGFIPDWVRIRDLETGDDWQLEWSINMRSAEYAGGRASDDDVAQPNALGAGIGIYRGGDVMTAASTVYLVQDATDKRNAGTLGNVNTWTLDTPASLTGHFNAGVNTTYVGEGSKITIGGKTTFITALSNDGDAANEVTLAEALPSGEIEYIGNMYDWVGAAAGKIIPPGIFIDSTAEPNASAAMCMFEAGTYDN